MINSVFLILFGIPALAVERDPRMRTLHRFRLQTSHGVTPNRDSEAPYLKGAQEVFQADDKVVVFVFGHTHSAFLRRLGPAGQVVINTGTWLKLFLSRQKQSPQGRLSICNALLSDRAYKKQFLPAIAIYMIGVYWVFRGKVRQT